MNCKQVNPTQAGVECGVWGVGKIPAAIFREALRRLENPTGTEVSGLRELTIPLLSLIGVKKPQNQHPRLAMLLKYD